MDPKELRGLMEAYSEVYAPQEEIEEAVKGASRHDTEMRKAAASERRSGIKPLPAKEGEKYAKYKMAQMDYANRKRMGEEVSVFDVVLEFLQAEGFAETLEEAEWMMANVIDEEAIDIILGEGKVELDQERRSRMGRQIGKKVRSADAEYSLSKDTMYPKGLRGAMERGARKKVGQAQRIMGALKSAQKEEYELGEGHGSRTSFKTQSKDERWRVKAFGSNYTPHKNYDPEANRGQGQILRPNQAEKQRRKKLAKSAMGEEFELWVNALVEEGYDLSGYTWDEMYEFYLDEDAGIISGLAGLALGAKGASYAAKHTKRMRDYPKNFVKGIVDPRTYGSKKKKEQKEEFVGEAQEARNNPEKYEREQSKKSAPVRGERTPMPPRGDKRREDFEKWYAANVR